jgi:hypothetical protein
MKQIIKKCPQQEDKGFSQPKALLLVPPRGEPMPKCKEQVPGPAIDLR